MAKQSKSTRKSSATPSATDINDIKIIRADSLKWLAKREPESLPNVVTGICDLDEITLELRDYFKFFERVARLIFTRIKPDGYAILIQTDRKYKGEWFSKSSILTTAAYECGLKLVWHKIVLQREVDKTDLHRPGYSHMLCFTKNGRPGAATPDVIPVSSRIYKNATPIEAGIRALEFIKNNASDNVVIDPFAGQGTIPLLCRDLDIICLGIDIDPKQVEITRQNILDKPPLI